MKLTSLARGYTALAALMAAAALPSTASAQWTVVRLHPASMVSSSASGVSDGQQAGWVTDSFGADHASLWTGSAGSFTDLNPAGAFLSRALGVDGGQQAGFVVDDQFQIHAGFWTGTAASWADLHPAGTDYSFAFGVGGGQQVGFASTAGTDHASLWTGTAASWVDLHPLGAGYSRAFGAGSGQQVGVASVGGIDHASLWNGTAASWVDLNPAGAYESQCLATSAVEQHCWRLFPWLCPGSHSSQQGGFAYVGDPDFPEQHASLWTDTAASWVDLNPAGSTGSAVFATNNGKQVGWAAVGGIARASLWESSAASWVDLHAYAESLGYVDSFAQGVWQDGTTTYVVGYGNTNANTEALMWIHDPCALHPWSGVLQPINPDGSSIFKLGRPVPVRFRLTSPCDADRNVVARLYAARVSAGILGTEEEADSLSIVDTGNLFRYFAGEYIFNLDTRGLATGTWRLRIDMGDGVERLAYISLRR